MHYSQTQGLLGWKSATNEETSVSTIELKSTPAVSKESTNNNDQQLEPLNNSNNKLDHSWSNDQVDNLINKRCAH